MIGHAGPSGYDRLTDGLDANPIVVSNMQNLVPRAIARACRSFIKNSGNTWYHRDEFWGECRAAAAWMTSRNTIFHTLYGENMYRYLGQVKHWAERGNRLVASYHAPSWRMRELIEKPEHIKHLDAVVLMSNSQRDYFDDLLPAQNVHFIPHGIDTTYFQPNDQHKSGDVISLITVGFHLRDFKVLKQAALALQDNQHIKFVVVCAPDRATEFASLRNVETRSGLSDAELLAAYHEADALFLPLIDATANNTLLEALACGLPVLSTDLVGVRDYTNTDCRILAAAGDADAHANIVQEFASLEASAVKEMRAASRATAESLSWERIRAQLKELYLQLSAEAGP